MLFRLTVAAFAMAASVAHAQLATPDPDWKETEAPPPPALKLDKLIPIEITGATLRYGVDPASVSLGADGVVRYVVVARNTTGTVNAMYEGIRCNTAEVKVYARHNPDSGWSQNTSGEWGPLHDTRPFRHSLAIARTGACMGHAANRSAVHIVRDLRSSVDSRFDNESRR